MPSGSPLLVTLYNKPGCHLCEDAELLLELLAGEYRLQVTTVDITRDPVVFERYKWDIPVVATAHGQVSGRIDARSLRQLFITDAV